MQRIARTLLGLVFVVFSANYFHPFLPQPAMPPDVIAFIVPFAGAGFMTLIKIVELVAGLALIGNAFAPLALALLAPIIVGITFFHASLEPATLPLPLAILALELFLAWSYRKAFAPMLRFRDAEPAREKELVTSYAR